MQVDTGITTGAGYAEAAGSEPGERDTTALARGKFTQDESDALPSEKLQLDRIIGLPVQVDVCLPLPGFRVADLISLSKGKIVSSAWPSNEDILLSCGDVHLVWTEFEVVDQRLAVRVTRLA